jgi:hypothetical protein
MRMRIIIGEFRIRNNGFTTTLTIMAMTMMVIVLLFADVGAASANGIESKNDNNNNGNRHEQQQQQQQKRKRRRRRNRRSSRTQNHQRLDCESDCLLQGSNLDFSGNDNRNIIMKEEAMNCILHCMSPVCYMKWYGGDGGTGGSGSGDGDSSKGSDVGGPPLEPGEIDVDRFIEFELCIEQQEKEVKAAAAAASRRARVD